MAAGPSPLLAVGCIFGHVGRVAVILHRVDNVSRKAVTVAGSVSNVGGRAGTVGRGTVNGSGEGNIGRRPSWLVVEPARLVAEQAMVTGTSPLLAVSAQLVAGLFVVRVH